jgi:hypothetical protein
MINLFEFHNLPLQFADEKLATNNLSPCVISAVSFDSNIGLASPTETLVSKKETIFQIPLTCAPYGCISEAKPIS